MLVSIGEVATEAPAAGQLALDAPLRLGPGGGGPAAAFCTWAARLGEPARLITSVAAGPAGDGLVGELQRLEFSVCAVRDLPLSAESLDFEWLLDALALHG